MASPVEGVLELGARAPLSLTDALLAFVVHAPHAALPSPPDSSGYGFRDGTLPNNSAPSLPEISPPRRLSRRIAASTPPDSRAFNLRFLPLAGAAEGVGSRGRDSSHWVFRAPEIEAGAARVEEEALRRHLGTSRPTERRRCCATRRAEWGGGEARS